MGLDQYLKARTKTVEHKSCRGACGGLFPIAPKDNGTTEIGYWRKAYDVSDYLRQVLEINEQLERNKFENEYERADWQNVVTAFTKAKEILENDPDAEIYYMEWY